MTYFSAHCIVCAKDWTLELPYDESVFRMKWSMWGQGRLVQDVFPELTPCQREGLKTGICAPCWKKVFDDGKA